MFVNFVVSSNSPRDSRCGDEADLVAWTDVGGSKGISCAMPLTRYNSYQEDMTTNALPTVGKMGRNSTWSLVAAEEGLHEPSENLQENDVEMVQQLRDASQAALATAEACIEFARPQLEVYLTEAHKHLADIRTSIANARTNAYWKGEHHSLLPVAVRQDMAMSSRMRPPAATLSYAFHRECSV